MKRLQPGNVFEGFTIRRYISTGLTGDTYRATLSDNSSVALKILAAARADDIAVRSNFTDEQMLLREATAHRAHPHLVAYVASDCSRVRQCYLATRYVPEARQLRTLVGESLSAGFIVRVLGQVASALDYLHYGHPIFSPVVQRDVTPNNILIDGNGNAVLIDLGIACHARRISEDGTVMGTPEYMAPEQYERVALPASDQFGLAVVALHLLLVRPPLPPEPRAARRALGQLIARDGALIYRKLHWLPATARVIARAMASEPQRRYSTCEEFADCLRAALARDGLSLAHNSPPRAARSLRLPWQR